MMQCNKNPQSCLKKSLLDNDMTLSETVGV